MDASRPSTPQGQQKVFEPAAVQQAEADKKKRLNTELKTFIKGKCPAHLTGSDKERWLKEMESKFLKDRKIEVSFLQTAKRHDLHLVHLENIARRHSFTCEKVSYDQFQELSSRLQSGTPRKIELTRKNLLDVVSILDSIEKNRPLPEKSSGTVCQKPFESLFSLKSGNNVIRSMLKALRNQAGILKNTSETFTSAASPGLLLLLPALLGRPVALLDFANKTLTGNSFIIHPDLTVTMISQENAAGCLTVLCKERKHPVLLCPLSSELLVLTSAFQEVLTHVSVSGQDPMDEFLRLFNKRDDVSTEYLFGEDYMNFSCLLNLLAMSIETHHPMLPIAARPLSAMAGRGTLPDEVISKLRVFPSSDGLVFYEADQDDFLYDDTLFGQVLLTLVNSEDFLERQHWLEDYHWRHKPLNIGGITGQQTQALMEITRKFPEIRRLLQDFLEKGPEEAPENQQKLLDQLETEIRHCAAHLDDHELKFMGHMLVELKKSPAVRPYYQRQYDPDWSEVETALGRLCGTQGEDQELTGDNALLQEVNHEFAILVAMSADDRRIKKVAGTFISKLLELSHTMPETSRKIALALQEKLGHLLLRRSAPKEVVATEVGDAIVAAVAREQCPSVYTMEYQAPPSAVLKTWDELTLQAFWKSSSRLKNLGAESETHLFHNAHALLFLLNQDNVHFRNENLKFQVQKMTADTIAPENFGTLWRDLIEEHEKMLETPVFSEEHLRQYREKPPEERSSLATHLLAQEQVSLDKLLGQVALAVTDHDSRQSSQDNQAEETGSSESSQLVEYRQVLDEIRRQGIQVDPEGQLVIGETALSAPLPLVQAARAGHPADSERITQHPLYLDRKAGKTVYQPLPGHDTPFWAEEEKTGPEAQGGCVIL